MHKPRSPGRETRQSGRRERSGRSGEQNKVLVLGALQATPKGPEAAAEQRLFAVAALDNMQHHYLVPYGVKHPGKGSDTLIMDFAKRMGTYQGKANKR